MPDEGRGFGDFLKEKNYGSSFNRLRQWRDDGEAVIWIHTKSKMFKRLVHVIGYVTTEEDEKTKKEKDTIKFLYFNCHEEVSDYLNRKNSGFPHSCPICRFIDWLENNDNIPNDEEVWRAAIGDKKRDKIATKADFTGNADAGGDWRMSFKPTLEYVLAVIDDSEVDNGIVVAREKLSLIEATKGAIINEMDRKGPEFGNPELNPYAIKWKFNKRARKSTDYYDAYPYEQATLTDEIQELLEQPAIDLSTYVTPGDPVLLREIMEEHITVESDDVPFDILFDNVVRVEETESSKSTKKPQKEKHVEETKEEEEETKEDIKEEKKSRKPKQTDDGDKRTRRVRQPKPAPEPEVTNEEDYPDECGNCFRGMPADATECPHCGARYD